MYLLGKRHLSVLETSVTLIVGPSNEIFISSYKSIKCIDKPESVHMPCYEWNNSCQIIQRYFVRFKERNFCSKISEAYQDIAHKKSVNCELDKNSFGGVFVPFNDKMMIFGTSSHIISNFFRRRRGLYQDCQQYCLY